MSDRPAFSVRDVTAEPGTMEYGTLPALELADGTIVDFPIIVAAGAEAGPTLFVGAGVHGDEITGVEAAHQVMRDLDPAGLRGNVICMPIQNPLAVQMQYRTALQLTIKSSLDQTPGDPSLCFPGDPGGNTVQQMAHTIFEVMTMADAVIDLHTPATGGRYMPFVFPPALTVGPAAVRARELAKAFGPAIVLDTDHGAYITPQMAHMQLGERGIPAFGMETGEGGKLEEDLAIEVAEGIANVMRFMDMIDGEVIEHDPLIASSFTMIRATRGGLLHTTRDLGDDIVAGDLLATVTDRYGRTVEEIHAPHDGVLVRATTLASIASGERVAQLTVAA
jgi:predicted deacylase